MAEEKNYNAELGTLKCLVETGDYEVIDEQGITTRFFSGRNKAVFDYIRKHKIKFGKVPSFATLRRKFPDHISDIEDEDIPDEPLSFFCEDLRDCVKWNTIIGFVNDAAEAEDELKEERNSETISNLHKKMRKTIITLDREIVVGDCREIGKDIDKRVDSYFKRKSGDISLGITTGFDAMDFITRGIKETDLWTFIGYTNVGKTFMSLLMSIGASLAGYKPLVVTREMLPEHLMMRVDALWNRFPLTPFYNGKLTEVQEHKLKKYAKKMKEGKYQFVVEKSTGGITNIASLIDKHQPDICFVDGAYLMTEDSDDGDWQGIVQVWRGMKNIALMNKCPIVATMQSKESKARLDTIALAKYIAQDCDIVWGMEKNEDTPNILHVKSLKQRDAENGGSFDLSWDFTEMDWSMIHHNIKGLDEFLVEKNAKKLDIAKVIERESKRPKLKFRRT
jgi:hypothetical protein